MGLFHLPPNVAKLKARRDVDALIAALAWWPKKPEVAEAATRALGELKDQRAAPALRDRLARVGDRATIESLTALGDTGALPLLMHCLDGPHRDSALAAVRALGPDAVAAAVAAVGSGFPPTRHSGIVCLAALGSPEGVEPLIKAFLQADERDRAVISRSLADRPQETVASASRLLRCESRGTWGGAIGVLEHVGDPETVIPLLEPLLEQEPQRVLPVLRARGWRPTTDAHRVAAALVDEGWRAAIQYSGAPLETVLHVAASCHDLPAVLRALRDADPGWPARVPAALALAVIEDAVRRVLDGPTLLAAVEALGAVADPAAAAQLIGIAEQKQWGEVFDAVQAALPRLGVHAVPALVDDVARADRREGHWVFQRLVEIGAPAVDALVGRLSDRAATGRVARVLGRIGDPRAVRPLGEVLHKRWGDTWSIAEALTRIGGPEAAGALATALDKHRVMAAIHFLGDTNDTVAIRPLVNVLRTAPTAKRSHYDAKDVYGAVRALQKLLPGREASVSLDDLKAIEGLSDQRVCETVSSDYSWDTGHSESATIDLEWARALARSELAARAARATPAGDA
jgi:HEAT repeat protein